MQKYIREHGEATLVMSGVALALVILAAYIWGVYMVASDLKRASGGKAGEPVTAVGFRLKAAQDILGPRGLLQ
ncbi:MAG: hypothetical protein V1489_02440 [Candidatus Liptonbacteria bacterium]